MTYRAPVIGVLVAVLLTVGFWFLLYKPATAKQAALETETMELQSRQGELRSEIAFLEEIRDDEKRYRATAALLQDYVPEGVTQAEAVRQFQKAADAAHVEITGMSFTEPAAVDGAPAPLEPNTTLASIGMTMVVEGGYFQTVDFFRRIEADVPRAVLTQSANLTGSDEGFPRLATDWSGQLFAIVPGGAAAVPDAGVPPATEPGAPPASEEGNES